MKKTELKVIAAKQLVTLKRNPQYLTPKQMDSLKMSMTLDGFCAPILVRPVDGERFEIVSGNHRFMAATELGMTEIPCVVSNLDDRSAQRLAVNLNTIHGDPNAEVLAPFLCEMDESLLADIHLAEEMKQQLLDFDGELAARLARMEAPRQFDRESPTHKNDQCKCPTCGRKHLKPQTKV